MSPRSVGHRAAFAAHPVGDRAGRALAQLLPVLEVDARHPGCRGEFDPVRVRPARPGCGRAGRRPVLAKTTMERPSGVSSARLDSCAASASCSAVTPRERHEVGRLPVAQRDGAGLVQQQRVDVAGGFDRAARHGQHVALHQPVHAGDADRRQQRADRGGDQADQQRHHHDAGDAVAVERLGVRDAGVVGLGEDGQRLQGRHREHEDDGQRGQQDVQRDLVRRLLPVGALDEGDHPVDEALAGLLGDLARRCGPTARWCRR